MTGESLSRPNYSRCKNEKQEKRNSLSTVILIDFEKMKWKQLQREKKKIISSTWIVETTVRRKSFHSESNESNSQRKNFFLFLQRCLFRSTFLQSHRMFDFVENRVTRRHFGFSLWFYFLLESENVFFFEFISNICLRFFFTFKWC